MKKITNISRMTLTKQGVGELKPYESAIVSDIIGCDCATAPKLWKVENLEQPLIRRKRQKPKPTPKLESTSPNENEAVPVD